MYLLVAEISEQEPREVLVRLQVPFVLNTSIKVLLVAREAGFDVILTVIETKVDVAGTVNRYHTSYLLPPLQLPVGLVV